MEPITTNLFGAIASAISGGLDFSILLDPPPVVGRYLGRFPLLSFQKILWKTRTDVRAHRILPPDNLGMLPYLMRLPYFISVRTCRTLCSISIPTKEILISQGIAISVVVRKGVMFR